MSQIFGGSKFQEHLPQKQDGVGYVFRQREFAKLLSFAGWSIDDVVNNPIAKLDIRQWYRINRNMHKRLEIFELEKQWNPLR